MGFENVGKILREGTSQTAKTTKKKKQTTGLQPLTDISQKQSSQNPSKTTSTKSQNATKKANTFKVPESRKAAETPQVQTVLEKAHPEIKSGIMPVQPKKYDAAYFDRKAHQPGQSEARKYDKAVAQYLPYLDTLKKNVDYYSQNKTVQFKLDNGSIKTGAELAQEAQTEYNRVNSATAEYREIRDYYKGLVFDKPRKATLKDYTINSFKRGWNTNEYGKESANAMFGAKNSKKYYENLLKGDDYNFKPQGLLGEGISGAVEFLGQNANRLLNPNAWAAALGAGGAASVAGKAGPQALLPEEVITVPAAAAFGFKASSTYDMFKTEAGLAYNEMIGNGATPKTARNIATVVGVVNAALEMMQLDDLVKSFKILKDIDATKPLAKKIASYVLKRGANVASETAQEMAQETVTIAGANLASKMDKGKWENDWQEAAQRVLETGKSSALSFAITGATGDIANYGVNKTAETVNKTIIQPNKIGSQIVNKGGAIGAIDEGLGFGLNTDAYKNAQKLSQKIVDNKNVSNYSIGKQAILNSEQNIETLKRNVADDLKTYGLADIKGLTEAMTNLLTGEKISGNQAEIIARSKDAVRLLEIYTLEDIDTDRGISQIKEAIKNLDTSQLMPSLFEISPQQRISDFAETLGNSGKNTLTKFYNGAQNAEDYVREMNAVYQAGRNNTEIPLTDTINSAQAQAMYQAGQVDIGKVSGYNVNNQNNNVKGAENYASTRGQNNRQSGKRYDSSNTQRQVSEVASGTGRNAENGQAVIRPESSRGTTREAQKVTAKSLGISGGDARNSVNVVTDYEGRAEVEMIARRQGLKVVAFSGDNLSFTKDGEEFTARGAIEGGTMYLRTDSKEATAVQIAKHEATHDKVRKGQINLARVKERAYDASQGKIEVLERAYASAFNGLTANEIWEEIVCDSVASMNLFEYTYGRYSEETGMLNQMVAWYTDENIREIERQSQKETWGSPDNVQLSEKDAQYSRSFSVSYNESRQLDNYIISKNNRIGNKLIDVDCKEVGNNFYIWKNIDKNNYEVVAQIEIEGNEDFIDYIRGNLDGFDGKTETLYAMYNGNYGRKGTYDRSNLADQRGQSDGRNDRLSLKEQGAFGRGNTEKGIGNQSDGQVKFSFANPETDAFSSDKTVDKKYNAQIDRWLKGELKSNDVFELGETPFVLQQLKAGKLPVVMSQDVMAKMTGIKHNISIDEIRNIPQAIADPIMIFKSATVDNSLVILTELTDKHGDSVVVAMHLNRYTNRINVNRIASVYGKENIKSFVTEQISQNNLRYIDDKKSQVWATSRGLQLPKLVQSIPDNNIVLHKNDIVNTYSMQNSENDAKFSRSVDTVKRFQRDFSGFVIDNTYALTDAQKRAISSAIKEGNADISQTMEYGKVILYHNTYNFIINKDNSVSVEEISNNDKLNIHENEFEEEYGDVRDTRFSKDIQGTRDIENGRSNSFANGGRTRTQETDNRLDDGKSTGEGKRDISSDNENTQSDEQVKTSRVFKTYEEIRQESEDLRKELTEIRETLQSERTVVQKSVKKVAADYIKDYNINAKYMSREEIEKRITEMAEYVLRADTETDTSYNTLINKAYGIASDMVDSCETINTEKEERYRNIKNYFKNKTIRISNKEDIVDYNAFRRRMFGKLNLSLKNGMPIDTVWAELGEMYGKDLFSDDIINPTDQILHCASVLNNLSDIYENPHEQFMDRAKEELAIDVVNKILSGVIKPKTTILHKRMSQYSDRIVRLQNTLKQVRERRDENYADLYNSFKDYRENVKDKQLNQQLLRIMRRLQNKKLPTPNRLVQEEYAAEINRAIGKFNLSVEKVTPQREARMHEIAERVTQLQNEYPEYQPDNETIKWLTNKGRKTVSELSIDEKHDLIGMLLALEYDIDTYNKFLGISEWQTTHEAGLQVMRDVRNAHGGFKNAFEAKTVLGILRPDAAIKKMVGYNHNNPLYQAFLNYQNGETEMIRYGIEASAMFERFNGKDKAYTQYKDFYKRISGEDAEHIAIIGTEQVKNNEGIVVEGRKVKVEITPAMRMSIYMHSLNRQNLKHMTEGGLQIPNINSKAYKNGKMREAYQNMPIITLSLAEIRRIIVDMTVEERTYCRVMQAYFDTMSKPRINEVALKLYGVEKANVDNYFPISVVGSFRFEDLGAVQRDGSVTGMGGRLNERIDSAKPIYLFDANDVVKQSVLLHSRFVGLAIPYRDMNKLWNVQETGLKKSEMPSALYENSKSVAYIDNIKKTVSDRWSVSANDYIDDLIRIYNQGVSDRSGWDEVFSNYQKARIDKNLAVSIKQAASFPTAAAEVGHIAVLKAAGYAITHFPIGSIENQQALLQNTRYQYRLGKNEIDYGKADIDVVQAVDTWTVAHLLPAAEFYVREYCSDLAVGSDEYNAKVQEVFDDIIMKTQPNYTPLQRPAFLRSKNPITRRINIFKTQPYQNFNILYDAVGEYKAAKRAYNYYQNTDDIDAIKRAKKQYDTAKTRLAWAVTSQISSSFIYALMQLLVDLLRSRRKPNALEKYKDKDGKMNVWTVTKGLLKNMFTNAGGMLPLGSEFVNIFEAGTDAIAKSLGKEPIFDEYTYDLEMPVFSMLNAFSKDITKILTTTPEIIGNIANGDDIDWLQVKKVYGNAIISALELNGTPIKNITNFADTVISWLRPQKEDK